MKRNIFLAACLMLTLSMNAQREIVYHVFQRSFFDSNNDGHGDLKGIEAKIEYFKRLGVTAIQLSPVYQSDFYDNYFVTDFEKIDTEYGTFKEYRDLVQALHRVDMKVYQEVSMDYIGGKHQWFTDSYKNSSSKYSSYLVYEDKQNQKPFYYLGIPELTLFGGSKSQAIAVNMKDPKVKEYALKVLKYWADPNGDGKFFDGVDGFRIAMADNTEAGKQANLLKEFWLPIVAGLKKVNPGIVIIADQADHNSYGYDYFKKAEIDGVMAFKIKSAIDSFDKKKIEAAVDSTFHNLQEGKLQWVFIEDSNTKRFATIASGNAGKLRAGAALNFLLGGIPVIYYGQEIGMKGEPLKGQPGGDDIPVREAFEWYTGETGQGMALWYKDTGPWWDNRNMKANDGISFEEQVKDKNSLWSFYKELILLKKTQPALIAGEYSPVSNSNDEVLSFIRTSGNDRILVVINLSGDRQETTLDYDYKLKFDSETMRLLMGTANSNLKKGGRGTSLSPYAVQVWKLL